MTDPRKAKSLDEASANGDGTYNGAAALSWLSEVLNPGKGMSEQDVRAFFDQEKRKRRDGSIR